MSFLINPFRFEVGAIAFAPDDLSSLVLWLDAADVATITKDGSNNVSDWNDKSSNEAHATQTSSSQKPDYESSGINSQGSLRFDGSNDELDIPGLMGITGSQNRSVFAVFQQDHTGSDHAIISLGTSSTRQSYHLVVRGSDNLGVGLWADDYNSATLSPGTAAAQAAAILDGTTRGDITLYLDGSPEVATGTGVVNTANPGSSRIGSTHGFSEFDGLIAEVIVYASALSTTDRQKVEGYLAHKWGIIGSLPSGHPYKSTAP